MPTTSFPAQSQVHNVREKIFRTFFSCCCRVFKWVNDWLVVWLVLFWLAIVSGQCFISIDVCLFKVSTITSENGLWNVYLKLLCCHWTRKCQIGFLVSGSAWNCVPVSVLLQFCNLRHTVFTPGPNDGLHLFVLILNATDVISLCIKFCWEPV